MAIAHPGDDATLGFTILTSSAVLVAVAIADTVREGVEASSASA